MLPVPRSSPNSWRRQEAHLRDATADATDWLLPSPPTGRGNGKGGAFHISPSTLRKVVKSYVLAASISDRDGQLAIGFTRICFAITSPRAWSTTTSR